MPARAIASGTVSFGLVSIPVKVYSATESSGSIHFNLLHKGCGSRLQQQYLCAREGIVVPRTDMVKGYEFAEDQYVTFTNEELKELEEQATQSIDITEFVPVERVDPIFYDRAYFLGPGKGGDKAYRLLATAMTESGRAALAKYAARGKQYLVMLRATEDGHLVMQQLHYSDEVRDAGEIDAPKGDVREGELKLALQIIDQIARDDFDPSAYSDEVQERIEKQIQKKVEGKEISLAPTPEPKAQIIDLMEALKASVASKGAPSPKSARRPAARPAARKKSARSK